MSEVHDAEGGPRDTSRWCLVLLVLSAIVSVLCVTSCASRQPAGNGLPSPAAAAAPSPSPERFGDPLLAEFLRDPMEFFFDVRAAETIECGQRMLKQAQDFTSEERRGGLTALAAIYVSLRREPQARAAILQLLAEDPVADLEEPELLPPPVVRLFYGIRDSLVTVSGSRVPPDIHTVAVGEIENTSIFQGEFDLDRFVRGLRHIITIDLMDLTPMRIVDRQRLDIITGEFELSGAELAEDPGFRSRLRRLTGAESYIFGTLMQTNEKDVQLDLRWVQTETGEVLLAEGALTALRSSDDLFKLERKVLFDLLIPGVHELLSGSDETRALQKRAKPYLKQKKSQVTGETTYIELLLKTGEALLAEGKDDYATAADAWDQVLQMRPDDAAAKERVRTLQAHLRFAEK